jgi:hypothetical protein
MAANHTTPADQRAERELVGGRGGGDGLAQEPDPVRPERVVELELAPRGGHDLRVRVDHAQVTDQLEAVHVRDEQIDDHEIVAATAETVERREAIRDADRLVAQELDERAQGLDDVPRVVDDEHPHGPPRPHVRATAGS